MPTFYDNLWSDVKDWAANTPLGQLAQGNPQGAAQAVTTGLQNQMAAPTVGMEFASPVGGIVGSVGGKVVDLLPRIEKAAAEKSATKAQEALFNLFNKPAISQGKRSSINVPLQPFMEGYPRLAAGTKIQTKDGRIGTVVSDKFVVSPGQEMGATWNRLYKDVWDDYYRKESENMLAKAKGEPAPHTIDFDATSAKFDKLVKDYGERIKGERDAASTGTYIPKVLFEGEAKPTSVFASNIQDVYGIKGRVK